MENKAILIILGFLIFGTWVNTARVYAASSVNTVYLYDALGTQIWSHSNSKWDFDYIRVDVPDNGLSVVAVSDDPADSSGCVLCYWNDGGNGWSSDDSTPIWTFDPRPPSWDTDFYSVAISGNGEYIATGPSFGSYVFSSASNVPLQTFDLGSAQSYDLTFDGQFGACGNREGEVSCFSKDSSTQSWNYSVGGIVHSVAIQNITSPTDLIIAAGSSNGYVYVFDEIGGAPVWSYDADAVFGTDGGVVSVAMSDQGQYIAVGSYHHKLYLFNAAGSKLWEKLVPVSISWDGGWMGTESKSVAISADGQYIVAGGTDKLYLYDNSGTLIWTHNGEEKCVSISPNGSYIAACNYGGEVHLFSRTSSTPLWTKNLYSFWVTVSNPGYVAVSASAPPQYTQRFRIRQSSGVLANGFINFTKDGTVVGGPFAVMCNSNYTDYSFDVAEIPNDISWHLWINWPDGGEDWNGVNQPWPAVYRKTHGLSQVVLEEPSGVGGIVLPIDKLALLAPYIGLASTILVATVAAAIYVKRVKRRKEKQ